MNTLQNKSVVITGASRGIGKAISIALAKAGANLTLVARDSEALDRSKEEIEALGGNVLVFAADVTDFGRARSIIAECQTNFGGIDLLINNAGSSTEAGNLWEADFDAVWRGMEINLKGPLAYSKAALEKMVPRRSGTIINMGSYASIRPLSVNPGYASSKAGLVRLSDSLAASTKEFGIHVFTVSPGLVLTDMTRDEPHFSKMPPEAWSPITAICQLVEKLASGDYSQLSGRFIHVKDDLEALVEHASQIESEDLFTLSLRKLEDVD